MLSFKNDINLKNQLVAIVEGHEKADRIVKGHYWENGKGCCLGCMTEESENTHEILQERYNIPYWLGRVIDAIFEGLENSEAMKFPLRVSKAIPVGVDLDNIKTPFLSFVLKSTLDKFDHDKYPEVKKCLDDVIALYETGDKDVGKFREVAERLRSAAYIHAASAAAYAVAAAAYAADGDVTNDNWTSSGRKNQYKIFADELLRLIEKCK